MKATRTRHSGVHMFITHRLTLTLQLITSICSGLVVQEFLHCCVAIGKISTDTTHRGPSTIAELIVLAGEGSHMHLAHSLDTPLM